MQVLLTRTVPFKSRHQGDQGSGHPPPQGSASEHSEIDRGHLRDRIESSIHNHVHSVFFLLLLFYFFILLLLFIFLFFILYFLFFLLFF